eukprot:3083639-Amphidinium_carterae.1
MVARISPSLHCNAFLWMVWRAKLYGALPSTQATQMDLTRYHEGTQCPDLCPDLCPDGPKTP